MTLFPGDPHSVPVTFLQFQQRVDPATVTVLVTDPALASILYTFGTDPEVVKNAVGEYQLNITIPAGAPSVGIWEFVWTGTSPALTIEGQFEVFAADDALTITIEAPAATPIEDAQVTILTPQNVIVDSKPTDSSGDAVFDLEPDDYLVQVAKPGFRFPSSTPITVSGVTAELVTGVNLGIVDAPTVGKCRLYGYLLSATGDPVGGPILVNPVGRMGRALVGTGATGVNPESAGIARDVKQLLSRESDGFWEIELVQGSMVRVRIPSLGWDRVFRVPVQDSLNFADARPDPAPSSSGGLQGTTPQQF